MPRCGATPPRRVESRLEVLASDDDPRIGMALDRDDYHRLIGLLDHFYNLILLDTGTGILDSANQGLLTEADQIVLVVRAGLDGGRAGALTLDWMDEHGFDDLVARAVVVVNAQRHGAAPPDLMRRHFEKRCATRGDRPVGRRPRARRPDRHVLTAPQDPGQPGRHRGRGRRQLRPDGGAAVSRAAQSCRPRARGGPRS